MKHTQLKCSKTLLSLVCIALFSCCERPSLQAGEQDPLVERPLKENRSVYKTQRKNNSEDSGIQSCQSQLAKGNQQTFDGVVLRKVCSPYYFEPSSRISLISRSVTIEPGVTLIMKQDTDILVNGELNAVGTPDEPIHIRTKDSSVLWNGILTSQNSKLTLENVVLSHLGGSSLFEAIGVAGGTLVRISNTKIIAKMEDIVSRLEKAGKAPDQAWGINLTGPHHKSIIENTSVEGYPIDVITTRFDVIGSGNSFTRINAHPESSQDGEYTFRKGIKYRLRGAFTFRARQGSSGIIRPVIGIDAGVEITVDPGASIHFSGAELSAIGTEEDPIYIGPNVKNKTWGRIFFINGSLQSRMEHVILDGSYDHSDFGEVIFVDDDSDITLENIQFKGKRIYRKSVVLSGCETRISFKNLRDNGKLFIPERRQRDGSRCPSGPSR